MAGEWEPVARRVQVVRPVRLDERGLTGPTPGQARGRKWRRTSAGYFVPEEVSDELVEQRIVEAASRLRSGAVTGWAALRLLGGGYSDGLARDGRTRLPVVLATGSDRIRPRPGVTVQSAAVNEVEVVTRYGVRWVTAERAPFDEMRWASSLDERVVCVDMAAAAVLTSIRRMAAHARAPRRRTGRGGVIWALSWADERALSPQEVRLRMIWRRVTGWSKPLCNPTADPGA